MLVNASRHKFLQRLCRDYTASHNDSPALFHSFTKRTQYMHKKPQANGRCVRDSERPLNESFEFFTDYPNCSAISH